MGVQKNYLGLFTVAPARLASRSASLRKTPRNGKKLELCVIPEPEAPKDNAVLLEYGKLELEKNAHH